MKIVACPYKIEKLPTWESYVKKISTLILTAKKNQAQLVLFPEYAGIEIGGYHSSDKELFASIQPHLPKYCNLYQNLASAHQLYIQPGTIMVEISAEQYVNRAYFFGPTGNNFYQDKLQLTEFEKNSTLIVHGKSQTLFETPFGKIGIAICYDSEFPELVRCLTLSGAQLILVPSYTTSLAGFHRVMLSCRARALENQCYVAAAFMVGTVELSDPIENTVGQSGIFGPVEENFCDDGILAQGVLNDLAMVTAELLPEKIKWARAHGEVRQFVDASRFNEIMKQELNIVKI